MISSYTLYISRIETPRRQRMAFGRFTLIAYSLLV